MLISFPRYHQDNKVLVHTFVEGLEPNTKILLDLVAGEKDLEKTYAELYTLLNSISQGNPESNGSGLKPVVQKIACVLEIDVVTMLTTQISAFLR